MDLHGGNGVILEVQINELEALPLHLNAGMQTLSFWGYQKESLLGHLNIATLTYLDRIVPLGSALDFELIWDGYDLLYEYCRVLKK